MQYPSGFSNTCGFPSFTSPNHAHCMSFLFTSQYKHHHATQTLCVVTLYKDRNEHAYFWLPSSEETSTHELLDSPEAERLYVDQGEIVRVRVERDEFCDDEPGPPKATE